MPIASEKYRDALPKPIAVLSDLLERAGTSLIEATLRYSFFIDPEAVRARCPYYPDRARMSRQHYPSGDRGDRALWNGKEVLLGDNAGAQAAWEKYTGRPIARGSGYGVRHIWGQPWDPSAFTAGWNLCYMPFWLGMLTEDQHPHPDVPLVIRQISYDLYFADRPVCAIPDYVRDPQFDLSPWAALSIRLLGREATESGTGDGAESGGLRKVLEIRKQTNQSWSNLQKAVNALLGRPYQPFGTSAVASSAKSVVRRMEREARLTLAELASVFESRCP
ncbi:MAG TPA: hypothetical protein VJ276_21770 [Thermoanaerobaculia bacterium]|nr:hypothetical protein [Thermoanaerobaculia bacterium]